MNYTANNIVKLFIDAIGQDAFKDFYAHNWEARKKEIQKLIKTDYNFDIIHDQNFQRYLDILNEFVDWAKNKDYINTWDKFAILDLLIPYLKALQFTPQDVIPDHDFNEYTIMYSICNAYKHSVQGVFKKTNNRSFAVTTAIYQFNFYLPTYQYTTIVEPLEGVFDMFLAIVKDQKQLFEYWNDKKFEIDEKDSTDLKLLINRWTKDKTSRPTWKVIKFFMNEDLLPDDNFIIEELADLPGKDLYLTFRRRIFPAYFITNLFDSLEKFGFLDAVSKQMIQNGIRLFYRHFLVTKEQTLSQEEMHNPMFCMLYRFLLKDDMGYDFNTDTALYFKRYIF
ncbi:hypothetical protein [uncultured Treponema sp.]|uniref:hypothetical protein n=1 Tax=uncultured Treponema sp. TaxID=162155 RepID=UPI002593013B|nr:hypothetical protein [uncultured Treponema sp.]MDY4526095.1 hypothetical protein [Treponema sp.]